MVRLNILSAFVPLKSPAERDIAQWAADPMEAFGEEAGEPIEPPVFAGGGMIFVNKESVEDFLYRILVQYKQITRTEIEESKGEQRLAAKAGASAARALGKRVTELTGVALTKEGE